MLNTNGLRSKIGLFGVSGAALALLLMGRLLIGLFFADYPEAFAPLVWMLPGLVFLGFGSVCNTKLAGRGYPAITLWAAAGAFALNMGLGIWLIPGWGLLGAARGGREKM